jgi:kynurenine formamidase
MRMQDKIGQVVYKNPDSPTILGASFVVHHVWLHKNGNIIGKVEGLGKVIQKAVGVWLLLSDVPKNTLH